MIVLVTLVAVLVVLPLLVALVDNLMRHTRQIAELQAEVAGLKEQLKNQG